MISLITRSNYDPIISRCGNRWEILEYSAFVSLDEAESDVKHVQLNSHDKPSFTSNK